MDYSLPAREKNTRKVENNSVLVNYSLCQGQEKIKDAKENQTSKRKPKKVISFPS